MTFSQPKAHDSLASQSRLFKWKHVINALILWTFWVVVFALILFYFSDIPTYFIALLSSAESNYLFALLSIAIWFICKKIAYGKLPFLLFACIHFFFALFFSAFWLLILYGSWILLYGIEILEMMKFETYIGWQVWSGVTQYALVSSIFYTIIYYRNFKEKQLAEAKFRLLSREAELKALKMQLNPHFLFNSLNSINALVTRNPQIARQMLVRLSDLLRMSLETRDVLMVPLQRELDFAHAYLEIERIRFGDKMDYQEKVERDLLVKPVLSMILQPLLENAIKHGIANSRRGGLIQLQIKQIHDRMEISTSNNHQNSKVKNQIDYFSNGTGLNNIKQRLDKFYGDNYSIDIDSSQSNQFKVTLLLPFNQEARLRG